MSLTKNIYSIYSFQGRVVIHESVDCKNLPKAGFVSPLLALRQCRDWGAAISLIDQPLKRLRLIQSIRQITSTIKHRIDTRQCSKLAIVEDILKNSTGNLLRKKTWNTDPTLRPPRLRLRKSYFWVNFKYQRKDSFRFRYQISPFMIHELSTNSFKMNQHFYWEKKVYLWQ